MPDGTAVLRLMAMLSPTFPVGSFSYSAGLEAAVEAGRVAEGAALADWIAALIDHGSAWNDAVLLAAAWRADGAALAEVAELAEALAGSAERHRETMLQGAAFLTAARNWPGLTVPALAETAYPVAVGAVAGANALPLNDTLAAWLQSFASTMIQAAIRLGVTGQSEAVTILARLEPVVLATAARAARSGLDDLGSATIAAEILSMHHETQYSRLFRS
jgi:urease accessory protein